jgi:ATP adenylyltransferase
MDQLWAPWRHAYVTQPAKPQPTASTESCFICRGLSSSDDRTNLIVERGLRTVTVLNRFPYNPGHLLICPVRHIGTLDGLTSEESADLQSEIVHMTRKIDQLMNPEGYNIGLNLGSAAGAGLPGHLHWHIVPRWKGDMNFMPVIADTKVIVQSLDSLWERLRNGSSR